VRVRDTLFFSALGIEAGRALWKLTPPEWRQRQERVLATLGFERRNTTRESPLRSNSA
jgi:hypothetical protein